LKKKLFQGYRKYFISGLLIFFLGFVIYANSISYPFVYDDIRIIANNQTLRQPPLSFAFLSGENSNRPLLMLTFALNYAADELNPAGYRIVNILFHALNAFLLFIIAEITLLKITKSSANDKKKERVILPAIAGGLFFLCNPLATESVTYISSRSSVLSTTFILIALLSFIKGEDSRQSSGIFFLLSLLSFFAAFGFKETALVFPATAFFYDICFFKKGKRTKNYFFYIPILISALILIIAKFSFILTLSSPDKTARDMTTHFLSELSVIPYFLVKTLFPFNLNLDRDFTVVSTFLNEKFLLSVLIWSLIAIFTAKTFRRYRLFSFSIIWFFLCLSPHLFIRLHDLMSERWIYLSLAGTGFMIASLFSMTTKNGLSKGMTILLLLIVPLTLATVDRNSVYKNEIALWRDTVKKSPDKARPHNNLGFALEKRGFTKEAIEEFLKAVHISPDYIEARNNLGAVYAETGFPDKAEKEFRRAIALRENSPKTYNNLGMLYQNKGLIDLAIAEYKKAIEYDSVFAEAHNNLGFAFYNKGMVEEAMNECKKAVSIDKNFPEAYHNLGLCYEAKEMTDKAVKSYERALAINPKLSFTHIQLGKILLNKGLKEKALAHFKTALREEPQWDQLRELVQELE